MPFPTEEALRRYRELSREVAATEIDTPEREAALKRMKDHMIASGFGGDAAHDVDMSVPSEPSDPLTDDESADIMRLMIAAKLAGQDDLVSQIADAGKDPAKARSLLSMA